MARWVTPSPASSSSRRWSPTGSGVVRLPATVRPGAVRPSVPMLAALRPSRVQIWRTNAATDVLPFVPVTATIVPGWRG